MAIQLFCPRYDVADACYNVRNNSVVYAAHHVPLQCSCENLVHRHVNTVVYEYAHTMYNACSSKSKRIYSLFFQRTEICFAHSLWMEETETKKDFSFIPVSEFPPPGSHLNKPHFHYEQRGGENSLYVSLSLSLSLPLSEGKKKRRNKRPQSCGNELTPFGGGIRRKEKKRRRDKEKKESNGNVAVNFEWINLSGRILFVPKMHA